MEPVRGAVDGCYAPALEPPPNIRGWSLTHVPFKCGRIQGQDDRIARDHERVAHARACKFVAVIANLEALDDFRFLG